MNGSFMILMIFLLSCCSSIPPKSEQPMGVNPDLAAQTAEFKQEVIKVTDGVYVAVGYGLANSILLEGNEGVIIVDTMESAEAAAAVKVAFKKVTRKPVRAIVYTHYHSDHTFGARVMAGEDSPDIYSHEETLTQMNRAFNIAREITYRRAMRQFGALLPKGGVINAGIGPYLLYDETKTPAFLMPNKTFAGDRMELKMDGIELVLVHAPGETPDQIFVWLPEKRVLLPADNFYKSFPNLYAIRGTPYRDVLQWVESLDKMRALRANYLVPSHTRPISGKENISETLTNYRDAIEFVHDQTVRWMNKGLTPEEIVERVKLPPHLARQPYLQEYYGTVTWSVRGIFDGYMGWFSGDAVDLFALPRRERAKRLARIAGGENALLQHIKEAMASKDHQWALEMADHLLSLNPSLSEARELKVAALVALGEKQTPATARNYYLTQALETEGKLTIGVPRIRDREIARSLPLSAIFQAMSVRLDPVRSAEVDRVVGFRFTDVAESYMVHVRRGVAEIQPYFPEKPDNIIMVHSSVWKEIAAGLRNPVGALLAGDIKIEGGSFELFAFLSLFKDE